MARRISRAKSTATLHRMDGPSIRISGSFGDAIQSDTEGMEGIAESFPRDLQSSLKTRVDGAAAAPAGLRHNVQNNACYCADEDPTPKIRQSAVATVSAIPLFKLLLYLTILKL